MQKIPIRELKDSFFFEHFNIREIKPLVRDNDMLHDLHRHNFYFLLAIEKGSGTHLIDFKTYEIQNNVVFFIRPGQVHKLTLHKGATGFLLQFKNDFYSPSEITANIVLRKVSHKNFCSINKLGFQKINNVLNNILVEFTEKQNRYKFVIKAQLEILFIELERQSKSPGETSNNKNQYSQERLEELFALLERNITTKKLVSQYAHLMNLTSFQLNAITKSLLNKTCSDLINEHIILEAKRFLLASSHQINQIANELGYEDVSYFIRFFKKKTGLTPEAFRQNFK